MLKVWPVMPIKVNLYARDHWDNASNARRFDNNPARICRIIGFDAAGEIGPVGTGFLISPDLVLTCSHVVDRIEDPKTSYVCRFDLDRDIKDQPAPAKVKKCLLRSPPAPWERSSGKLAGEDHPDASCFSENGAPFLDFALLELGNRPVRNGVADAAGLQRGWFELANAEPPWREPSSELESWRVPLVVYQFPQGADTLKEAPGGLRGAIRESPSQGGGAGATGPVKVRLVHNAQTDNQSSGSPVISEDRVIALHQAGGPTVIGATPERLGRCVPMWEILRAISAEIERNSAGPLAAAWADRDRANKRLKEQEQRRSLTLGELGVADQRLLNNIILSTVDRTIEVGTIIDAFRSVREERSIRIVHIFCRSREDEADRFIRQLCWSLAAKRASASNDVHPDILGEYAENLRGVLRVGGFNSSIDAGNGGIGSYPCLKMSFPELPSGLSKNGLQEMADSFVESLLEKCADGGELPVVLAGRNLAIGPDAVAFDPAADAAQIHALLTMIANRYRDDERNHAAQPPPLLVVTHVLKNVEDRPDAFAKMYGKLLRQRIGHEDVPIVRALKLRDVQLDDTKVWRNALDQLRTVLSGFDPDQITARADAVIVESVQMQALTSAITETVKVALNPANAASE